MLVPQTDEERLILEENQAMQRELTLKHEDGMGYRLRVPYRHDQAIKHMIPELREHQPRETRLRAFKWFLRDSISKPYRVKA